MESLKPKKLLQELKDQISTEEQKWQCDNRLHIDKRNFTISNKMVSHTQDVSWACPPIFTH